jgi:Polyketide cyclase / dehydrase and lipid transport
MGGREQTMTSELTEHDPPRSYAFRVVDGAVRPIGNGTMEPLDGGAGTRFRFDIDFEGHGFGKLLLPLVRRSARKELAQTHANLKRRLEDGAT